MGIRVHRWGSKGRITDMAFTILIVEDEEDNRVLLGHILTYLLKQESVLTAADGHEAIHMAYEHRPDLILMDLSLPKMSGWEATRSLRSDGRFKDTCILALTAHAMVGDKEKAIQVGCNDYYAKPIDIDTFLDFIRPYLRQTMT